MERAGILVLLFLAAVFIAPSTTSQVLAADLKMMTIAAAEGDEEYDDYQADREEAAGDIYSDSEYQGGAQLQGEQEPAMQEAEEELEEPDFDSYEDEPDF